MFCRSYVKAGLTQLALMANFALTANAQSSDFVPFEATNGQAAKFSVFQEIPGFRSALAELDEGKALLEFGTEWHSMSETDVWIFFFKNEAEASLLPDFILNALAGEYEGSPIFTITAKIAFEGVARERLINFVFLEKFKTDDLAFAGCYSAAVLYFQLKDSDIDDVSAETEKCYVD